MFFSPRAASGHFVQDPEEHLFPHAWPANPSEEDPMGLFLFPCHSRGVVIDSEVTSSLRNVGLATEPLLKGKGLSFGVCIELVFF